MKHFVRAFKEVGTALLGASAIIAAIGLPIVFLLLLCDWFAILFGEFFAIVATLVVAVLLVSIALGIYYSVQERKGKHND